MTLVRIVKDWDWPDLLRQTPGGSGHWGGIDFTTDPVPDCDFVVMLNNRMRVETRVNCPPENVWVLMQEPYYPGFNDWMVEGLKPFARCLSHYCPDGDPRFHRSQPALCWHVNRTYDDLIGADPPAKTGRLSWILGNVRDLPGHLRRWEFYEQLKRSGIPVKMFGRAVAFIEDKWDGLAPYRYSLAVENNHGPDYWTEKVADCFLSWTVPVYYGCTNLEDYFPAESFVRIDILQPEKALGTIRGLLEEDDWRQRLPALAEARRRVLRRLQIFPWLAERIGAAAGNGKTPREVVLPAYRRSLRANLHRLRYKADRLMGRL